jgi:hypothetical protein
MVDVALVAQHSITTSANVANAFVMLVSQGEICPSANPNARAFECRRDG